MSSALFPFRFFLFEIEAHQGVLDAEYRLAKKALDALKVDVRISCGRWAVCVEGRLSSTTESLFQD